MEIQPTPAGLAQLAKGRGGELIEVDDDVAGVARGLAEIDPHIRLRFSETGNYWVVYWKPSECEPGSGYLIFTAQELDLRIVKKMEEVYWRCRQPGYSLAGELEKADEAAKAAADHEFSEQHGEMLERLAHAMRKDRGYDQSRIIVPAGVSS